MHFLDYVLSGLFNKICFLLKNVLTVLLSAFDSVSGSAHPCCSQPQSGSPCLTYPLGGSDSLVKLVSAFFSAKNSRPFLLSLITDQKTLLVPPKRRLSLLKPPPVANFELLYPLLGRVSRYAPARVDLEPDVPVPGGGVGLGDF